MFRPPLSLIKEQLMVTASDHFERQIQFKDIDGQIKTGYFKPCDSQSYPPLLAKYVVALSVFVRSALGSRASEKRLVYNNDADTIIGMVSLCVTDSVATASYLKYADKKTLLDKNVAELLLSCYKHERQYDYAKDVSVHAMVDFVEYSGLTDILTNLTEKKHSPENNLHKFQGVHYQTSFERNRRYGMIQLINDPVFNRQKHTAILKELLAYDENMLEERLRLYLCNEGLDLSSLPSNKRANLLKFGEKDRLFQDLDAKPNDFIKHCMRFYKLEHQKFETSVIDYPEFRDFLIDINNKPEELLTIKKWFEEDNKLNSIPHKMEQLDLQYQKLWLACFNKPLDNHFFTSEFIESSKKKNHLHSKK